VYALLNGALADKARMDAALYLLARSGIPFVLDVYNSDALTNTRQTPHPIITPFDVYHGRSVSVAQLEDYKKRYGRLFAGVRVFEVFSLNYTITTCRQTGKTWDKNWRMNESSDAFYQKKFVEDYTQFAHANGMFLLFGDWLWSAEYHSKFLNEVLRQPQNEEDLKDISKRYPGTVVVMYDNNEPNGASLRRLPIWDKIVSPFVESGAKGFGLSDQSWLYDGAIKGPGYELKCPVNDLIQWGKSAFDRHGIVVQLEPFWYWFKFPKPSYHRLSIPYTQDPAWAERGGPSDNLRSFATAFGVTLPGQ